MSVAPVIQQLRGALNERTRLENDFKTKMINRINSILEQLNDCDRTGLPPAAAGVLNIAMSDLTDIVREIRNPVNMTDANVEEIVEPLERRRRNNTMRLLPAGRPVDAPRALSNPAPASSLTGTSFWPFGRSTPAPAPAAPAIETPRGSSMYRDGPVSLFDLDDAPPSYASTFNDGLRSPVKPRSRFPFTGGKRTRRKYHRKA